MAYKLQIVDSTNNINFNGRYENLAKAKRPAVLAYNADNKEVKETTTYNGQVGKAQRLWLDADGKQYSKQELIFKLGEQVVEEISQTKVFDVEGFQPESFYTDRYIISSYYELFPDNNGMKKDIDRELAVRGNLAQMYRLYKHLSDNKCVARGEFCPSSRGFLVSDGYIRAITIDKTKWGLELGVFKEEKAFQHINEGAPSAAAPVQKKKGQRIKMV